MFQALVAAEIHTESAADSHPDDEEGQKMAEEDRDLAKQFREYRRKRYGKTVGEAEREKRTNPSPA